MKESIDILLSGGVVMTQDDEDQVILDGAVAVTGNRIIAVGPTAELESRYSASRCIDCRGRVVMPGLIDTYTHAGHGLIRGLFEPVHGFPSSDLYWHATTPGWWYAEARLAALERTRAGVTTAAIIVGATPARIDDPIYALEVGRANEEAGLRAVVCVGPPDPLFPHLPEPFRATRIDASGSHQHSFTYQDAVRNSVEFITQVGTESDGLVRAALSSAYLFGRHVVHRRISQPLPRPEDAKVIASHAEEMRTLADLHEVPIHTHMFAGSVDFVLQHLGRQFVDDILGPDVIVAHANSMNHAEIEALGRRNSAIAVVPSTHENIWYGFAPMVDFVEQGAVVSVSTDGAAPYATLDLWRELARCTWNQWHHYDRQDVLPPEQTLRMVTSDAAKALGMADEIGSLEAGKRADIITVDLRKAHLTPLTSLAYLLVHYTTGADVETVIVDGKILKHGDSLIQMDESDVINAAIVEAKAAFSRAGISGHMLHAVDVTQTNDS